MVKKASWTNKIPKHNNNTYFILISEFLNIPKIAQNFDPL